MVIIMKIVDIIVLLVALHIADSHWKKNNKMSGIFFLVFALITFGTMLIKWG